MASHVDRKRKMQNNGSILWQTQQYWMFWKDVNKFLVKTMPSEGWLLAFIKFAAELTTKNYMYLKIVEYPVSRACFQIFRAKKFFSQQHVINHFEVIIVTNSS